LSKRDADLAWQAQTMRIPVLLMIVSGKPGKKRGYKLITGRQLSAQLETFGWNWL
jgi:hypothetical protein